MKRWKRLYLYATAAILTLLGLTITPTLKNKEESPIVTTPGTTTVTKVIDGDTFRVATDEGTATIRMIGIDTPETKDPRRPVECFGQEASDKLKELIEGQTVRLEPDPTQDDKDKYGRLLRYVFLNETNINKQMIAEGYAFEYTYQIPYQQQAEFQQAERDAEAAQKGLWAADICGE